MRHAFIVFAGMLLLTTAAYAAEAPPVIIMARQRIEATDSRATGHLVQVDAGGKRVSSSLTIKAHWFPGVLRALIQIVPPKTAASADRGNRVSKDARISILLEMRPHGQSTIRVFHPHEAQPPLLPFEKWKDSVAGSYFNYEDFLEPEYYWQSQTVLRSAKFGAHDCDVVKSTPGASDRSNYTEVESWLDHTISYPLYVEKTLKDGGVVKTFTSLGLTQSGGVWAARQVEVKTQGSPGAALLIVERGSTKANLTTRDFSPEQISSFEDHP